MVFCWIVASGYTLKLRESTHAPLYETLSAVYRATYPHLAGLECASQAMANALTTQDDRLMAGEMKGYPKSPIEFPSNLQIALAVAADTPVDKAGQAWQVFEGRSAKPDYSNSPNFAVVPRSTN